MEVSVIMPVHNGGTLLARAMEGVLEQSQVSLELIVVDDASTDDSANTIRSFSDPRLRMVRLPENAGVSAARNAGLRLARGRYAAFADADDVMLGGMLGDMFAMAETHGADVVVCGYLLDIRRDLTAMAVEGPPDRPEEYIRIEGAQGVYDKDKLPTVLSELMEGDLFHMVVNKLYRRDHITGIEFDEHLLTCLEDELFNLSALGTAQRVAIMPGVSYQTDFSRDEVLSLQYDDNRYFNLLKVWEEYENLASRLECAGIAPCHETFQRQLLLHIAELIANLYQADFADPTDLARYAEDILATDCFRKAALHFGGKNAFLVAVSQFVAERVLPGLSRLSFPSFQRPASAILEQASIVNATASWKWNVVRFHEKRLQTCNTDDPAWRFDPRHAWEAPYV